MLVSEAYDVAVEQALTGVLPQDWETSISQSSWSSTSSLDVDEITMLGDQTLVMELEASLTLKDRLQAR